LPPLEAVPLSGPVSVHMVVKVEMREPPALMK
jgi:hypothetical protein